MLKLLIDQSEEVSIELLSSTILILTEIFHSECQDEIKVKAQALLEFCCEQFINEELIGIIINNNFETDINLDVICDLLKAFLNYEFKGRQDSESIMKWFPVNLLL